MEPIDTLLFKASNLWIVKAQKMFQTSKCLWNHGRRKNVFQGRPTADFSRWWPEALFHAGNSGEINFINSKLIEKHFLQGCS